MSQPRTDRADNPLRDARAGTMQARRALVIEAFDAFGEPAARRLARSLRVDFEACRETIARARREA